MAQFDRLQEVWQRQSAPEVAAADILELERSLRAYGRRQTIVMAVKAMVVAAVLAWSYAHTDGSPRVVAGLALVALAAVSLLVRDWRSQRAIARTDFGEPALRFLRTRIERLRSERDPCRRYYWPFMASMVIGMNLMLTGTHRWWLRAFASCLPFAAFELGSWARRKRHEAECRPLIDELMRTRNALEGRDE